MGNKKLDLTKVEHRNPHLNKKVVVKTDRGAKYKAHIKEVIQNFCGKRFTFLEEHPFASHLKRKYRFDYVILDLRLAIEYEGIHSKKSRHTTTEGYTTDTTKYNLATLLGWRILRYTSSTAKYIERDLNDYLDNITVKVF